MRITSLAWLVAGALLIAQPQQQASAASLVDRSFNATDDAYLQRVEVAVGSDLGARSINKRQTTVSKATQKKAPPKKASPKKAPPKKAPAPKKPVSKPKSPVVPPKKTSKKAPSLPGRARFAAPAPTPVSQSMTTFCQRYRQACIGVAMDGKTSGEVEIVLNCKRASNGVNFHFGCKADGLDVGPRALERLGAGATVTATVTTGTVTQTITTQALATSTATASATTSSTSINLVESTVTVLSTMTVPTTVSTTQTTEVVETSTQTITSNELTTLTNTATVPAATTTTTLLQSGPYTYPVTDYIINPAGPIQPPGSVSRRADTLDATAFCQSFGTACASECASVKSKTRRTTCKAQDLAAGRFSLACICSNGKSRTQYALAKVGTESHLVVVSTVGTATATATTTSTVVVPTVVYSTSVSTLTAYVPVTTTSVATATSTITTTGVVTTTSTFVVPTAITVTNTATASTTLTSGTATSTTIYAVAPTGVIAAKKNDGTQLGYINANQIAGLTSDAGSALSAIIVRDADTGLYSFADGSGNSLIGEAFQNGVTFAPGQPAAFALLETVGTTQTKPGPASGTGAAYGSQLETFIFNVSPVPSSPSIELTPVWTQPDGSRYTTGSWLSIGSGDSPSGAITYYYNLLVADAASFISTYGPQYLSQGQSVVFEPIHLFLQP